MSSDSKLFTFVTLADRPCRSSELPPLRHLIQSVNVLQPAFLLHVGGNSTASVAKSEKRLCHIKAFFNQFDCPVILTPGEREWVDAREPFVCLEIARSLFWNISTDPVNKPVDFSQQANEGDYKNILENLRWVSGCVLFLTLHTVGYNNNLGRGRAFNAEFTERNKANLTWLDSGFSFAIKHVLKGVVICTHANLWLNGGNNSGNGFRQTLKRIRRWTKHFPGRVLVIHGEQESLLIDQPLTIAQHSSRAIDKMMRIRVPGGAGQGVVVGIDPNKPNLFSIQMLTPTTTDNTGRRVELAKPARNVREEEFQYPDVPAAWVQSS